MSNAEVIFTDGPFRVLVDGTLESYDGQGWGMLVVANTQERSLALALAQALAEKHRRFRELDEELSTALPEIDRLRSENADLRKSSRAKDNRIAELEEALALESTPDPDTLHSRDARTAMDIVAKYGVDWDEVGLDDETIEWIVSTAHRMADAMAAKRQQRGKGS